MSNLKYISDDDEFKTILKSEGNQMVVVDFYTTWCGPCRQMEPTIQSLAMKYPTVLFLKVDADKCFDVAMKHDVNGVPLFVLYTNQVIVDHLQGAHPIQLDQKIQNMEREFRKLNPSSSQHLLEEMPTHLSHVVSSIGRIEDVTKYLDREGCQCINDLIPSSFDGFLKGKKLVSGKGSGKLVLVYVFTEKLMLHSFKIKARTDTGPKVLRLFSNHPKILDFNVGSQLAPSQEVNLSPDDLNGETVIELRAGSFKLVSNLQIFVTQGMNKTPGHHRVEIESLTIYGAPVMMNGQPTNLLGVKSKLIGGPSSSIKGQSSSQGQGQGHGKLGLIQQPGKSTVEVRSNISMESVHEDADENKKRRFPSFPDHDVVTSSDPPVEDQDEDIIATASKINSDTEKLVQENVELAQEQQHLEGSLPMMHASTTNDQTPTEQPDAAKTLGAKRVSKTATKGKKTPKSKTRKY